MKYEIYADLVAGHDFHVFEFMSIGRYGSIPKRIAFIQTELPEVDNLAFGDNAQVSAFLIKRKIV